MDNLEPYPGFYNEYGYGEDQKYLFHYAKVSMLNIYIYIFQVIYLGKLSFFFHI